MHFPTRIATTAALIGFLGSGIQAGILMDDGTPNASYANLQLWLRADAGLYEDSGMTDPVEYDGDLVKVWANQANTTVVDAIQGIDVSPQAVSTTYFGNPANAVRFNGSTTGLDVADHDDLDPGTGGLTVIVAGKQNTATYANFWYGKGNASSGNVGYGMYGNTSNTFFARVRGSTLGESTRTADYTNPIVFSQTLTGSQVQGRLNGSTSGWTTGNYTGSVATADVLKIGGRTDGSNTYAFSGDISEMLLFNRELTEIERRSVEDYLYEKYLSAPVNRDYPLVNNLRIHATLDPADIDGTTVMDTAGTPQNGTSYGNVGYPAGILGGAMSFERSNDSYVSFGNVLDPGNDSYSVSVWLNTETVANSADGVQFIASKGNSLSADPGWAIWLAAGGNLTFRGKHADGGGAFEFNTGAGEIDVNQWYHAVLVLDRDDQMAYGYLDGELVGSDDLTSGLAIGSSDPIVLGKRLIGTYNLVGMLDDFAVWDRALSPEEVAFIHGKGLQGLNAATIPEPSSMALIAWAMLAFAGCASRRSCRRKGGRLPTRGTIRPISRD